MSDYPNREAWLTAEEDAERRDALAAALKRDEEVYLVHDHYYGVHVFGHRGDADAYALAKFGTAAPVQGAKVLDHADARRLIEQEGET